MNLFVPTAVRTASKAVASLALVLPGLWLAPAAIAQTSYENYTFITLAGQQPSGWCDGTGSAARFNAPFAVAADTEGNCYVADCYNHTVRKVSAGGVVTTLAGLAGNPGAANGAGHAANFNYPRGMAVDSGGNAYAADFQSHTIRKITPAGLVTTLAGLAGTAGTVDGTGSAARFMYPQGLAVNASNNLYVADTGNCAIRKITPAGVVTTLAGKAGIYGTNDATKGANARFRYPYGVAVDAAGNVYVADTYSHTIRKVSQSGAVTTLAGAAGTSGTNDGAGTAARFCYPYSVAVDAQGNIYVADTSNHTIRMVTQSGAVTTLAGVGGSSGSADGASTDARFTYPCGVALAPGGSLLVADTSNQAIRQVVTNGTVTTLAGVLAGPGSADGPGTAARFNNPCGVGVDSAGNVYVSDLANNTIRRIAPGGAVTTLAGLAGSPGTNDGTGSAASFREPAGLAVDQDGNVYVAEFANHTIRKVTPAGVVTTLAGSALQSGSTNGPGTAARFFNPTGVAVDNAGNVYVADTMNDMIRKIAVDGTVSTVAGTAGSIGAQDGPAASALFGHPQGIAVDAAGNLFVADTGNAVIRKITPDGTVSTLAGKAQVSGAADGVGGAARFNQPFAIALDPQGALYVAESGNNTIRKVAADGTVTTLGGIAGVAGGVDGTGFGATFDSPEGVAVGTNGILYVSSSSSHTIRKGNPVLPDSPVVDSALGPPGTTRHLDVAHLTATSWAWSIVRCPASSTNAQLSSTSAQNPTLTPDVPDLFVVRFQGTDNLGRTAMGTVWAVAADLAPPALTITAPVSKAQITNSAYIITGSASDDVGVGSVWCRLNGGAWVQAAGTTDWRAPVNLALAQNTLRAYAVDLTGKYSHTNTVNFTFSPLLKLGASGGAGMIAPYYDGQPMVPGKTYTINATPAPGEIFVNWTDGTGHVLGTNTRLTFTMTPNLVLVANFEPNPFLPLKGTYAGLFADANADQWSTFNAGLFSATLTDKGGLTAKLQMGGATYPLSGSFSAAGTCSNWIASSAQGPLSVKLQLDLSGSQGITGVVGARTWSADLAAYRGRYSLTNRAPESAAKYTLVIPGAQDPSLEPGGYGFGTLSVDPSGNVNVSVTLGDGNKATQTTVIVGQGQDPDQWPLYLVPTSGQWMVRGWLGFVTNATDQAAVGQVSWVKAPKASDKLYAGGFHFSGGLDVSESPYSSVTGTAALGWTQGELDLTGGNLPSALAYGVQLGANNKLGGTTNKTLSLTITSTSGTFLGSVPGPAGKTLSVSGVVLQNQNAGFGLFLGQTQSGSVRMGGPQ